MAAGHASTLRQLTYWTKNKVQLPGIFWYVGYTHRKDADGLSMQRVRSLIDQGNAVLLVTLVIVCLKAPFCRTMSETTEEIPPILKQEDPILAENVLEVESASLITVYTLVAYGVVLLAIIGGLAYYFLGDKLIKKKKTEIEVDDVAATNTVGLQDVSYLATQLSPGSSHLDVLMAVASTPENIAYGLKAYQLKEKARRERIQEDLEEAKKKKTKISSTAVSSDALLSIDDEGWADDDDDDERAKAAAKAEEEKKKEREQLQKAVGKQKVKMEGIDEGVLGQKWVENTLSKSGVWPPKDLGILQGKTFDYEGKKVSPLDHPGLRRNLCMITGRLNSMVLNSHPELRKLRQTNWKY